MAQKQFSLNFHRDVEAAYKRKRILVPTDGFATTVECLRWASENKVPTYHLFVTEYDLGSREAYDTFAIVEQLTLEEFERPCNPS